MKVRKLSVSLIIILAMLLGILPAAAAYASSSGKAYYVSCVKGDDKNSGISASEPFKTFSKAISSAQPGDTVYIMGGTYTERLNITKSGEPDAYITFKNYNNEKVIIDGKNLSISSNDYSNGVILIKNKSYIRIIGLNVTGYVSKNAYVPSGIMIVGNSKNIEILNCSVYGIATTYPASFTEDRNAHAIAAYGTNSESSLDGLVIDGCDVYNNVLGQSETITLNGNVTNFKITNNKVHDNDNIGICVIGYEGISSSSDSAKGGEISCNRVWNISSGANKTYTDKCADGIYVDGGADVDILRNLVYNCDIGIEAACETKNRYTDNVTIANNIVYNCSAVAGVSIGGAGRSNGGAKNIKIVNNTIYNNVIGVYYQYNCQFDNNIVKNNIIYKCSETTYGTKTNIVYENNITVDPKFVAPGTDFHLQKGSPAIDAGKHINISGIVDFDGKPRLSGSEVDCGAYEYQVPGTTPPVVEPPVVEPPVVEPPVVEPPVVEPPVVEPPVVEPPVVEPPVVEPPVVEPPVVEPPKDTTPEVIAITIDGNSSDWQNISPIISKASGTAQKIKMYNDSSYLYICVTGSSLSMYPNIELMINTDGNSNTGYKYSKWKSSGCDYTLENGELYRYTGRGSNWSWKYLKSIKIVRTKDCIEYKVSLSDLGLSSADTITAGFILMDKSWNEKEQLPGSGGLPGYTLK